MTNTGCIGLGIGTEIYVEKCCCLYFTVLYHGEENGHVPGKSLSSTLRLKPCLKTVSYKVSRQQSTFYGILPDPVENIYSIFVILLSVIFLLLNLKRIIIGVKKSQ